MLLHLGQTEDASLRFIQYLKLNKEDGIRKCTTEHGNFANLRKYLMEGLEKCCSRI